MFFTGRGSVAPVSVNAPVNVTVDNNGRYRTVAVILKQDRVYTKRR